MIGWPCVKAGVIGFERITSASRPTPAACEPNSFVSATIGRLGIEAVCDMRKKESIMKKVRMLATRRESCRILGGWRRDIRRGEGKFGKPGL